MHRERERVRGYEVNRLGEDGKRVIKKESTMNRFRKSVTEVDAIQKLTKFNVRTHTLAI